MSLADVRAGALKTLEEATAGVLAGMRALEEFAETTRAESTELRRQLKATEAQLVQSVPWIACSDYLPDLNELVLFWCEGRVRVGRRSRLDQWRDEQLGKSGTNGEMSNVFWITGQVTHWMPVPPAPPALNPIEECARAAFETPTPSGRVHHWPNLSDKTVRLGEMHAALRRYRELGCPELPEKP